MLGAMGEAATKLEMTAAEYLAWEREQLDKHEFHLGEVFAMAGGSPRHNALSGAVIRVLGAAVLDKGCHVLTSDQKIAAEQGRRYVYADAVVVCGPMRTEPGTNDVLANPRVIVEVLSKSTEHYDRVEKWAAYQRLDSVTDYLLVSQTSKRVEHYVRESEGSWRYRALGDGDMATLSNGAVVSVDAVYRGVFDFPAD